MIQPPPPAAAIQIAHRLMEGRYLPPGKENELVVLSFVYFYPNRKGDRALQFEAAPSGSLAPELRERPLRPADVVAQKGLYLGVSDAAGRFRWLAPLSDPRVVRGEDLSHPGAEVIFNRSDSFVVAGRFPHFPGGTFEIFEVSPKEGGVDVTPFVSKRLVRLDRLRWRRAFTARP